MSRLLLLLLIACSYASAQETWQGLRFGMSEADAQKAYRGTLRSAAGSDLLKALEDVDQKLEGMSAHAVLLFDKKTDALQQIIVNAQKPFAGETNPTNAAGSSLAAINLLHRDLAEKYGTPITEDGECNLTAAMIVRNPTHFSCKKIWKSGGQTITMNWFLFYGRLDLMSLTYKTIPKGI